MDQTFLFPQRQELRGRLQAMRDGVVVEGLAAGPRGSGRGEREVAEGDREQVSELAVLHTLSTRTVASARLGIVYRIQSGGAMACHGGQVSH